MPRKDGLSTNAEMLADFRFTAHEAFVEAYDRKFDQNMHPGFEGKPLSSLYLFADRMPEPVLGRLMVSETMMIQPMDERVGDSIEHNPSLMNELSPDVRDRYRKLGATVSKIALSNDLDVASVLPMEAVYANYSVFMNSGKRYDVGLFTNRRNEIQLASAKSFAEETLEQVRSYDFIDRDNGSINYNFDIELSPYIPLNGFEPRHFLIKYRRAMVNEYNKYYEVLSAKLTPDNQLFLESFRKYVMACAEASERAQSMLDNRNDYV